MKDERVDILLSKGNVILEDQGNYWLNFKVINYFNQEIKISYAPDEDKVLCDCPRFNMCISQGIRCYCVKAVIKFAEREGR